MDIAIIARYNHGGIKYFKNVQVTLKYLNQSYYLWIRRFGKTLALFNIIGYSFSCTDGTVKRSAYLKNREIELSDFF